jgi:predicted  nucleic acid-binding Zn-ribbon protein
MSSEHALTASSLADLHHLHQRAKALRDLMSSGPKTLAAREAILASRKAALEVAQKEGKDSKAHTKNKEVQIQALQTKIEDSLTKRNTVRKQEEYNALTNQMAADKRNIERLETEVLEALEKADEQAATVAGLEGEVKKLSAEVATLKESLASKAGAQQTQLRELELAITSAEESIPADQRDQYRRLVKQRAADALAAVEGGACSGCFVSVTPQMVNELINRHHMVFCKTCGRALYLAEQDHPNLKRS